MLSTPTVQRHEKFANVARKKKTCHDMSVSVSVSLIFKMSNMTFPTKMGRGWCVGRRGLAGGERVRER